MNSTAPIVLGIVGSPRRSGNTELLVDEVIRGAQEAGARTAKVILSDLRIHPCLACEQCIRTGHCAQKDDMQSVAKLMSEATVWILGTPVYLFSPTAQFKAYLDRWVGIPKEVFEGKGGILVVPFAAPALEIGETTLDILRRALHFRGMKHLDSIVGPGLLEAAAVKKQPELLAAAYEVGQRAVLAQDHAEPNISKEG